MLWGFHLFVLSSISEIARVTKLRQAVHTTLNGLEWTFKTSAIVFVISLVSVDNKESSTNKGDG